MVLQQQKSNVAQKVSFALAAKAKEYKKREGFKTVAWTSSDAEHYSLYCIFLSHGPYVFQKVQKSQKSVISAVTSELSTLTPKARSRSRERGCQGQMSGHRCRSCIAVHVTHPRCVQAGRYLHAC